MDKIKSHPKAAESVDFMDSDPITEIAKTSGKIADAVKVPDEVKNQALLPAATSIGGRLGRFFKRNQVNQRAAEIVEEQFLEQLSKEASLYFNNHPNATIDEAKERLIYKQIDDSTYSIDNEEMRTLFAKLIANTADTNTNAAITPYYSQVLSNLSPKTAKLLLDLSENTATPIMEIVYSDHTSTMVQLRQEKESIQSTDGAINQFISQGLVEIGDFQNDNHSDLDWFATSMLHLKSQTFRIRTLVFTEFGNSFIESVK
ncbi:DUF4393 domain-containing protein [Weissella viridescens]|uniref:DUF4393 domain-containing protein n=1 Tax=Weissella viridescens TaxID=1629 RepID=A0A3P2RCB0_WEIVI|nr:Abi-alpha family protein [Weissella viridescens]RRG18224.1 DUF4393 domain-containing protein [Weissella viridescens]